MPKKRSAFQLRDVLHVRFFPHPAGLDCRFHRVSSAVDLRDNEHPARSRGIPPWGAFITTPPDTRATDATGRARARW